METKKIDITYKETDDNRVNNETKEDDETMEHIPVESIGEDDDAFRRRDDEIERFRVASSSSQLPQLCRVFTFSEIQLATQKFNESLVIGRGGFGKITFTLALDRSIDEEHWGLAIWAQNFIKEGGQNQTLHKFHFGTLKIATESFSEANRVVELKPYDFLYKGKLQNGQGIIVSRIRFSSRYDSFMSEASILVKLHHENLAKLLGYCIEGTGLFLVYKFALHPTPNRLMFDPTWIHFPCDRRYKIILGVARALLYLHKPPEPLPMRIIHVDLAPQCILLDENLNPILLSHMDSRYFCKINDPSRYLFSRYLAPELMSSGDVSPKTDVFSFGLLVLETITGHRMAYRDGVLLYPDYKFDPDVTHTLKYVERSWLDGTLANIYPIIHLDSSSMTSVFEIGLLCVRADPADRPTMEDVVSMLLDSSALARPVAKLREMITKELSNSTSAPVDNHNCNTLGDGYDYDNVVDYYDYNPDAVEDLSELYPR
ncbi:hypothetical protein QVD17_29920 [Tagetes erecta]|uniref:Protein kinase domain-containing protein n=1 Tax=Tagetes erecta TaxID=13708 RepID=A0AAD8K1U6_TARER|nr:hypothetical protein QVD17_29920 [Tagetes erecta]